MSYDQIPGYSGFLSLYSQAVEEAVDGDVMVEVGVALGHSVAFLARKVIDSGKDVTIYAVDPWSGYARNGEQQAALGSDGTRGDFRLFLDQMLAHAPEELERIRVLRATSQMASWALVYTRCALVLIDAAHDHESVFKDISYWKDLIKPGGILAGDDHEPNYPGVERACRAHFGDDYEVTGSTWLRRM